MKRLLVLYKGLLFAVVSALILGFAPVASADEAPKPTIYVVEVLGEPLVAERLRAAVARELSVTAVAPDDPRAATATARLQFDARGPQKTLRVTFSRTEVPVTRVVTLPDDAARAETVAVFLAGNLARDEASDLLRGLAKADAQEPASADDAKIAAARERAESDRRDAEDLVRMRTMLHDGADDGHRERVYGAVGRLALAAAVIVPGVIVYQNGGDDVATRRDVGVGMVVAGAALTVTGALTLLATSDEEAIYGDFTTIERDGQEPSAVLHRTERRWRTRAQKAKATRLWSGYFALGTSVAALTFGTLYALPGPPYSPAVATALLVSGGASALAGFYTLATESGVERSYRTWASFRAERLADMSARTVRPTFGFAPMPGGGFISGGFAF
ncbi:MAG: hypothetical protein JWO86_7871 [Myxococcaceae bacterium]|jgi:hypothetical protein|nr:hypothetical protein [Myxococcaceae bacterium]MEA2749841.1 hypothetical protein [Myxococcales bacterium]